MCVSVGIFFLYVYILRQVPVLHCPLRFDLIVLIEGFEKCERMDLFDFPFLFLCLFPFHFFLSRAFRSASIHSQLNLSFSFRWCIMCYRSTKSMNSIALHPSTLVFFSLSLTIPTNSIAISSFLDILVAIAIDFDLVFLCLKFENRLLGDCILQYELSSFGLFIEIATNKRIALN